MASFSVIAEDLSQPHKTSVPISYPDLSAAKPLLDVT